MLFVFHYAFPDFCIPSLLSYIRYLFHMNSTICHLYLMKGEEEEAKKKAKQAEEKQKAR